MSQYCSFTYQDLLTKKALIPVFIISIALTLLFIRSGGVPLVQQTISSNSDSDNWTSQRVVNLNASNTLCFLIRVRQVHLSYFPVLALALSQTGFDNIHLYVINIDKSIDKQLLLRKIDMINTFVQRVDYISLLNVGKPEANDFGFSLLDRALTYLYNQYERSPSACEYIIMTNGDNFYSSELQSKVFSHMVEKKDIIAWNFISRNYRPDLIEADANKEQSSPQIVDKGTVKCLPVALRIKEAPLGSAAFRLAFLKQHKLYHNHLNRTYDDLSDGYFVQCAASLSNASVILTPILFVY